MEPRHCNARALTAVAALLLAQACAVHAADVYPSKPVRLNVPAVHPALPARTIKEFIALARPGPESSITPRAASAP